MTQDPLVVPDASLTPDRRQLRDWTRQHGWAELEIRSGAKVSGETSWLRFTTNGRDEDITDGMRAAGLT